VKALSVLQERTDPTRTTPIAGFAIVLVAATLFGTLGPLSRVAYEAGFGPLSLVAWRATFGAVVLVLAVGWGVSRGRPLVPLAHIDRRARLGLAVATVAATTLNLAMFAAFQRIPVALALLAFYTYPAMTAAVAVVLGHEPLDRPRAVALGLATGGMMLVLTGQFESGGLGLDPIGIALALSAAVSQTVFVTVSRDAYRSIPADQSMVAIFLGTIVAGTGLALIGGAGTELTLPLREPSVLPILVVTGVGAAALPSLLFLNGIRLIGGTRAAILMLLEPVVGAGLAAVLLGETLQPIQVLGGAGILAAALVLQRAVAPRDGRPELEPRAPA
jgi:DME family drug/metabolite transporter